MELNIPGFLRNEYVYYPAILSEIGKSSTVLQPLFEAFTNAMEAIRQLTSDVTSEEIRVKVFYETDLFDIARKTQKLVIEDTGIGFNDAEFQRFLTFKDNRKGFHNRGSGRIQFIHFFGLTTFESVFRDGEFWKKRVFTMSKNQRFLDERAIAYLNSYEEVSDTHPHTSITLSHLLNKNDEPAYNMTLANFKDLIIEHYIQYLCANRENLPRIILEAYKGVELIETLEIKQTDIPPLDENKEFILHYRKFVDGDFKELPELETFTVQAFKIQRSKLPKNILTLTSKGEIVNEKDFRLQLTSLSPEEHLENNRYLFLISSPYVDDRDGDMRGQLRIPRREKGGGLFDEKEIYLDDIEQSANDTIIYMYNAFQAKALEKAKRISDLKEMFLLGEDYLKNIPISINDSEEKILERVYTAESKLAAKADAELKKHLDRLTGLNPAAADYDANLTIIVDALVKQIPLQNRAALTHYVARRKLVINLFQKVLGRKLDIQGSGLRNQDERLLHNILFSQGSDDAQESDLWLLNEDFILFRGVSESKLKDITLEGDKIFKDIFTEEEQRFVDAGKEKRLHKRPDVLLFPAEEKCIILEFKSPDVNVADHLAEVSYYASLILNLTKPEYPFKSFYGYLIGENLEPLDVKFTDSDFQDSAHFNYAFRPAKRIIGQFKPFDGSLYTEILKYSTLCERADKRNTTLVRRLFPEGQNKV
jgi:hypothetical protein